MDARERMAAAADKVNDILREFGVDISVGIIDRIGLDVTEQMQRIGYQAVPRYVDVLSPEKQDGEDDGPPG